MVLFFLSAGMLHASKQGEIVLLTSADNQPYEFIRGGVIVGFDIDLAKAIAERLGKKLIIKDMPFASIIPSLVTKQGDFAMAAITPTGAKRENVDFSVDYQSNVSAIVFANGDDFAYMQNRNAVFPLALLAGRTVGVQLGTHHETDILTADIPNLTIRRYDNIGAMVAEILNSASGNGNLYALVIGVAEARILVGKNPKLCYFPLKFSDSFAVALPRGSPHKAEINRIIEFFKESGKISDLEIKWDINR
ncbi:MAG: transporter substrate-binding domain-containing protein [Puniceicoccales bacterium]|nr:transporter substrate-binding domain-containing protein [Puniceicoccales bacterium]